MVYNVVLLPQAQEDLNGIKDPLFSKVVKRLMALKQFPEMGMIMIGVYAGYRATVVAFFRIVYRILPRGIIEVAYIRHCKREFPLLEARA